MLLSTTLVLVATNDVMPHTLQYHLITKIVPLHQTNHFHHDLLFLSRQMTERVIAIHLVLVSLVARIHLLFPLNVLLVLFVLLLVLLVFNNAAVRNAHHCRRLALLGAALLNRLDNVHSLNDNTEGDVVSVQPGSGSLRIRRNRDFHGGDEKLGTVRVRSRVRHGDDALAVVLDLKVLVVELLSVDAFTARSGARREVSLRSHDLSISYALNHEVGNNAMEHRSLVREGISLLSDTVLSRAETDEVLHGDGNDVSVSIRHAGRKRGYNPITILPADSPSISMSKYT